MKSKAYFIDTTEPVASLYLLQEAKQRSGG